MKPTGHARLAGILGWPVSHSRSPQLHGYWLERYGIDGAYIPLAVRPEDFAAAVALLPRLGFAGANVTVPHKEAAFAACHALDETARRIGAVNTLIFTPDGVAGRNTDAFGFIENLRRGAPEWSPASGPAVMLGAGGAARAVAVALLDAGVSELRIVNRTHTRAIALADEFGPRVRAYGWQGFAAAAADAGLLVNTTSLGMTGMPALAIELDSVPVDAIVNDLVYSPLETPLLAAARRRGHVAVDGLGMLLYQAQPGFAAWFGTEPAVTDALRAAVLGV
jgi:shikimate dehydrogenase